MSNLKPCPFCGGAPITDDWYGHFRVYCLSCLNGFQQTRSAHCSPAEDAARAAWNLRTPDPEGVERVAREIIQCGDWEKANESERREALHEAGRLIEAYLGVGR
jgi:hypothetical protein